MNEVVDIIMLTIKNDEREVHVIDSGGAYKVEAELNAKYTNPVLYTIKSMPKNLARGLIERDKDAKLVDHTRNKSFDNPLNGVFGDMFGNDNPFDFFGKK